MADSERGRTGGSLLPDGPIEVLSYVPERVECVATRDSRLKENVSLRPPPKPPRREKSVPLVPETSVDLETDPPPVVGSLGSRLTPNVSLFPPPPHSISEKLCSLP